MAAESERNNFRSAGVNEESTVVVKDEAYWKAYRVQWRRNNKGKLKGYKLKYLSDPKNVEKQRQTQILYKEKNREQIIANKRERYKLWRIKNPQKKTGPKRLPPELAAQRRKLVQKTFYWKHRERMLAKTRSWRDKNIERVKANGKAWRARNKNKVRAKDAQKRARKNSASVGDLEKITAWEATWRLKKKVVCYWCKETFSGSVCHSDHIIALVRGGPHCVENLCVSCPQCNFSKHKKSVEEWNKKLAEPVLMLDMLPQSN